MHRPILDMLVIGFALFSMFFGAGNVIFPPYLGLSCGAEWFAGFVWYYLADIGLALLALFAVLRCGSTEKVMGRLGAIPSKILLSAIVLCIGPMLAIPRTAATTLEMAVNPLLSGVSPLLFSILFFALIAALCVRQSAVVDIVGKFLTPALLIGLLVLIVLGVINPIGPVPERVLVESVAVTGIAKGAFSHNRKLKSVTLPSHKFYKHLTNIFNSLLKRCFWFILTYILSNLSKISAISYFYNNTFCTSRNNIRSHKANIF